MSDVYEKDFEEKAQPALTDFLRLIGGDDDAAYKVLVSDIAKAIIEQYSGSTIAGEAQSLQTALNAIDASIGNTAMGTTATTVTGAIAEHTDLIGDTAMGTTATTLTGAIGEHSDLIGDTAMGTTASTLTGAIAEHSDLIGDDTMGTTATTLTGAIAEHEQELGDLNSNTYVSDTASSGGAYAIYKRGNVVEFWYSDPNPTSHTVNAWNTLFTIPSGYRPKREFDISIPNNLSSSSGTANSFTCSCRIGTDGIVKIWPYVSGFNAKVHAVWLV